MATEDPGKKSMGDFINILLLIIFVPTDIFYLFYFGKEGYISKQRLI